MFILKTQRLIVRDLTHDDWRAMYALSQEPAVTRYQTWLQLADESAAHKWVDDAIYHNNQRPRAAFNLAIVQMDYREVIGWLGWGRPSHRSLGDYDFGYALHPSIWGRGYMTEVLSAAVHYMFEEQAAQLVYGECSAENIASARVMEKVGFIIDPDPQHVDESDHRYIMARERWLAISS